jgi:hypothetical protein
MKIKASSGIFGLINGRAEGNYTDGPPDFQAGYFLATKKHKKLKKALLIFELFLLLCGKKDLDIARGLYHRGA